MDVLEDRHYGHIAQKVEAKENSHMCHDECGFLLKGYLRPIITTWNNLNMLHPQKWDNI